MNPLRVFRRRRRDEEISQEIEWYIAQECEENVARGMALEEARRQAYLKFGNPQRVREEVRVMNSWAAMETLWRDLRYAERTLRRNPGYALVAVLTLGLGIGANTAIFTVIRGVLLRPLPYAQPEQIVHLDQVASRMGPDTLGLSVPEFQDYRDQSHAFASVAEYHSMLFTLLGTKNPERVVTGVVSANYFDVMGVKPLLGRLITPADETRTAPPVLVLSYAWWMKEFGGDRKVLGRALELNDRVHIVIGVLPPLPDYPDANDVFMPTTSCPYRMSPQMASRDMRMITAYARLKPGAAARQAQTEVASIADRMAAVYPKNYPATAGFAAQATPLGQELTHTARPTFLTLLAAAGLVLLLACANLALSRQLRRSQEMAIRIATGASTWDIVRQLLVESMVVALAGGALGVGIAAAGSSLLGAYAARMTPLAGAVHLDAQVLLFALGVSLLTGVVFGALPGWMASRVPLLNLTQAGERMAGSESGTRVRNVLVAAQVMFSFVLLMCAGLMLRSLHNLFSVDPGFKSANVLSMQVSLNWTKYKAGSDRSNFFHQVLERTEALPGVQAASISWMAPLNSGMGIMSGGVRIEGQPVHDGAPVPQVDYEIASTDYFRVLGIPVLSGRTFNERDTETALSVVIVNARMAKHYWPGQDPIGHRISTDNGKTWKTIVGVASNVHQYGLDREPDDSVYLPLDQDYISNAHILVRTRGEPMQMANAVAVIVHQIDPQQPVTDIHTLDQLRFAQLGTPRVTAVLLGLFAAVALFITVVGVSGTLALAVARRTKEIGIRMALGASRERILKNVLLSGLAPVVAGVGIGAVMAVFFTRLLANMLFAVKPNDPVTFAGMAALLLLIALAGCAVPARRATHVDPMKALRSE